MGATQNRCDNILMLFRFIISSGIADFWTDRNSKLTIGAFSFRFKCLVDRSFILQRCRALSGTALLYRMSSCSTAVLDATYDSPQRSHWRRTSDWKADQSQRQSNAALCRCLGPQYCDRSFGRHIVWKVARGGTCDPTDQKRRRFKSRTRNHRYRHSLMVGI